MIATAEMTGQRDSAVGRKSRSRWASLLMIVAFSAGLLAANAGVAGAIIGGQVAYPSEYPYFVKIISTHPDGSQVHVAER